MRKLLTILAVLCLCGCKVNAMPQNAMKETSSPAVGVGAAEVQSAKGIPTADQVKKNNLDAKLDTDPIGMTGPMLKCKTVTIENGNRFQMVCGQPEDKKYTCTSGMTKSNEVVIDCSKVKQ